MCVEMQLSHHELCWCCCLCRGSATRRLECWWIEHRVYRERRQLQHEHRSSHESGSVVSTADAATPNEGRNREDSYTPTRVFQNTVVSRSHRVSTIVAARHEPDMVCSNKEGSSSTDHDQHAVCSSDVQP